MIQHLLLMYKIHEDGLSGSSKTPLSTGLPAHRDVALVCGPAGPQAGSQEEGSLTGKRILFVPLNRLQLQKWQGGSRDPQRHRHGRLMRPQTRLDRQKTRWGPDVEAKDRKFLLGVNFLILAAPIRLEFLATTRAIVVACYTTVSHRE
jgi:hypothetical protein